MSNMTGSVLSLLYNDFLNKIAPHFSGAFDTVLYRNSILDKSEGSKLISQALLADTPLMVARYGTVECQAIYKYLHRIKHLPQGAPILPVLCNNAGFFPNNDSSYNAFCELMIDSSKDVDILAVLRCGGGENYLANHYCRTAQLVRIGVLDPIHGWTESLQGKRVLVIHPFEKTIRKQYETHRKDIFMGTQFLPVFELKTIKAVQTIAGNIDSRFMTWFDALDYMTEQVAQIDFDVALIGCGAYGFPLAARVKRLGKKAIHMGGALQLLFGICGQRWDNNPYIKPFINDSWVRPDESELVSNAESIEGACYW